MSSSSFSSSGPPRVVVSEAEYQDWFDSDGRLVREARMRQRVFEGERAGVSKVNRREKLYHWGINFRDNIIWGS